MKILFSSHFFPPSVGGLENVGLMLAEQFSAAGHEVRVLTQTANPAPDMYGFDIIRRPTAKEVFRQTLWCDVAFQNNISLRTLWPLAFIHRPWLVTHHIWMERKGRLGWLKAAFKKTIIRLAASNIAISHAMAKALPIRSEVIPDPYCDTIFKLMPELPRDKELIFVGRLVSAKGVDLLIEALAALKRSGLTPNLTIVGSGREESALRELAQKHGLTSQVTFAGVVTGHKLAELLNQHSIMVVPSRWNEPFGIVALEGIACGCVIVGSEGGGLKEAIGLCGPTFRNGSVSDLAGVLRQLLSNHSAWTSYRRHAEDHLVSHTPRAIGQAYLRVIESQLKIASPACLEKETSI